MRRPLTPEEERLRAIYLPYAYHKGIRTYIRDDAPPEAKWALEECRRIDREFNINPDNH